MPLLERLRLNLLPDYFVALYEQWHTILWCAAPPSVAFFLWWSLGNPPSWITALWFAIVLFFAGYMVWQADHVRLVPKFSVPQFHIQHTPNLVDGRSTARSIWIQIEPECLTDAPVEECQGRIIRVLHKWPADSGIGDGGWEATEVNEPQALSWSLTGYAPITLYPGVPQRLNIFWIHSDARQLLQPCVESVPLRAIEVLSQQGSFRFEVQLRGKDCTPVSVAVECERGNPWDKPNIKLITLG